MISVPGKCWSLNTSIFKDQQDKYNFITVIVTLSVLFVLLSLIVLYVTVTDYCGLHFSYRKFSILFILGALTA